MSISVFSCPICGERLERDSRSYRCGRGHCFDIAKEGYVNLLPANRKHSEMPGDDREMVKARTAFLDGGWYAPLRELLCEQAAAQLEENAVLIDAGCGEGYYTEALSRTASEKGGRAAGVDLSKAAVRRAARRCPEAEIAVASVYHMPLEEESVSVLVNCFAPLAAGEFRRSLKPGGHFLYVVPEPRHLWEMKEILYDEPYENERRDESYEGFRLTEEIPIHFAFTLREQEALAALFHMTPYTWKTPKEGIERLQKINELTVTAAFRVLIFEKDR